MSEKPVLSIVTKTVRAQGIPIQERMYCALMEYRKKWHDIPEGLLLGPNEWLEFTHMMREAWSLPELRGKSSFHGVVITLMCRSGVDVVPSESVVLYLAKGTIGT